MSEAYNSGGKRRGLGRLAKVFAYSVVLVASLVFVLPFTQHLSDGTEKRTVRSVDVALPPPPPPPPEPPPPQEEKVEEPKPELQTQPKPLSLSQLQLAMNPGTGNALGATFGMGGFEVDANALDDIGTFSIAELDEKPRVTREPTWRWPRRAMGKIKQDIKAYAIVLINERGEVEFQRFRSLSDNFAEEEMIEHFNKFRFTAPTKDGKPVRARFAFPINFEKP